MNVLLDKPSIEYILSDAKTTLLRAWLSFREEEIDTWIYRS